jgi:hypothetical protein
MKLFLFKMLLHILGLFKHVQMQGAQKPGRAAYM